MVGEAFNESQSWVDPQGRAARFFPWLVQLGMLLRTRVGMRVVCLSGQVPNGLYGLVPFVTVCMVHLPAEVLPLCGRGTRG